MKLHLLAVFLGIIMLSSSFSISSSQAFLPENLPDVSQATSHVRVIEGENIIAYARPLLTSPDNPNNHEVPTSDPHDGVAKLILTRTDGTFGCSGTLAADNIHVFTAAHCVADNNGNYILTSGYATFEGNPQSITITIDAANSLSHPDYDGDYIKGNDIAILKLVSIPSGVPGIPHATSGSEVGNTVDKSGYGISGYFDSGTEVPPYYFGTQREGQNRYDAFADTMYVALGLTSGVDFIPGAIYQFDSDDGTAGHDAFGYFFGISNTGLGNSEVMSASGDSGGPTFENGELVGITSYGITLQYTNRATSDCTKQFGQPRLDSSCGEFAGDTRVASYSTWIDSVLNSVIIPNNPPTADANGPYSGNEDSNISFDGTGSSDPDFDPLTYSWDFGDGSTGSGDTPTHAYSWGDTFDVTLTVSDGKGGSDIALSTATISQVNDAPIADANGPYNGIINEPVTFDGSGSFDPDNQDGTDSNDQMLTYSWDFGDTQSGTGVSPSHTYTSIGEYTVELTVSDGVTSDISVTSVIVNDVSAEVSITSISPNSVAKSGSIGVTISGSGFVTGASVSLTNGSGPTPTVSNVVVVDDSTITATITAKSGGPPRDSTWDVTVSNTDLSNDTLAGGFTVTPN